jgi:hypothetical protein
MLFNLDRMKRLARPDIIVPPAGMVCLANVRGMQLRVTRGSVWVTQDGAGEDVSLNAGESVRITHNGRTLVNACQYAASTSVALEVPTPVGQKHVGRLRLFFSHSLKPS